MKAASQQLSGILNAARPVAIAALLRHFPNLDDVEDAFQTACVKALTHWPQHGIPENPEAWLILVGRNAAIDEKRKTDKLAPLELITPHPNIPEKTDTYGDDVLQLLYTCCHASLSPSQQVALCLKVIGGLTVEEIASAFLAKPATIAQRLTRAKKKVSALGHLPEPHNERDHAERLTRVQAAIYLLFNEGYAASGGEHHIRELECREAIHLARLLHRMWPENCETMGLLSLCLFQHARRHTRLDENGHLVLLEHQDRTQWEQGEISEATEILKNALHQGKPGPYQLQASIAGIHATTPTYEQTDWEAIRQLYASLCEQAPSPVTFLNLAAATFRTGDIERAETQLSDLRPQLENYLYFHGLEAEIFLSKGNYVLAEKALRSALHLAHTPAETSHIEQRIANIKK